MMIDVDNLGFKVRVKRSGKFGDSTDIIRNVTEIHYKHNGQDMSVAFKSDVHGAGINVRLIDLAEFETLGLETQAAACFSDEQAFLSFRKGLLKEALNQYLTGAITFYEFKMRVDENLRSEDVALYVEMTEG